MNTCPLSKHEFLALAQDASVLEADSFGPKVFLLQNGRILKLFRRKRLLSSALFRPYSARFADNARRLKMLDVPTVDVCKVYKIDGPDITGVLYEPLPGHSLAQLSQAEGFSWDNEWRILAEFIRQLHRKGVYFRSLHLGNIIRTPEGRLGLIDISDMRFLGKPLPPRLVRRNVAHFERYLKREGLAPNFPCSAFHHALLGGEPSNAR